MPTGWGGARLDGPRPRGANAWSVGRGLVAVNAMQGAETLHRADRADQIWTDDEITRFCAATSPEVGRALRLACATGLRRGALVALDWSQVGATAIVLSTAKTGSVATIPLIGGAGAILAELTAQTSGRVLLNSRGTPWTADGLENRIIKAKAAAGVAKRLHDARGTFATRLRLAGLTRDEIAAVMGWDAARVERILARYVDNERIVRSIGDKLAGNNSRAKLPNGRPNAKNGSI